MSVRRSRTGTPAAIAAALVLLGTSTAGAGELGALAEAVAALPIHEIQGRGSRSPYEGSTVTVRGVVTAVKGNGFFLQTPEADEDGDPATSEGIFVYTGKAPPASAAPGTLVEVRGAVLEYVPSADPGSPPLTEISGSPSVTVLAPGHALPAPVRLTAGDSDPAGELEQLERFEGMRVSIPSLTVVGPTGGWVDERACTVTSNGVFYGVITGLPRPFREAGIAAPDPLPLPGIPRFDANPERLRVDSDALSGAVPLEVAAGAVVTGLVGPLDYAYRAYTVLPEPGAAIQVAGGAAVPPLATPRSNEMTVATWNLQRFFDATDDPGGEGTVLSPAAYELRLGKASVAIREVLGSPDVLAVQEVESLAALEALAARVDADALAAGSAPPLYVATLLEGSDPSGIDVGVLTRAGRVGVTRVEQLGKDAVFDYDGTLLNDRPPLLVELLARPVLAPAFDLTVIVVHMRSLIGIDDPSSGPRVRAKRAAQAELLARLVQQHQTSGAAEHLLVLGDFNAFEVNDGYVDVLGTVIGSPTPAGQVLVASPDLVEPDLVNLCAGTVPGPAYEYVFEGNAQSLVHVLASAGAARLVTRVGVAHMGADYPETWRTLPGRAERVSDHDALVVHLASPATVPGRAPRRLLGR